MPPKSASTFDDAAAASDALSSRLDLLARNAQFAAAREANAPRLSGLLAEYGVKLPEPDAVTGVIAGADLESALAATPSGRAIPQHHVAELKSLIVDSGLL
jgi:hypothetical protein